MPFKEKVIWITGASSGIGEHLAYAFVEQGARVVLTSRNEKELERVQRNCGRPDQVFLLPADVTDFDRAPELARRVTEHFAAIDILVNNAGISQRALAEDTLLGVDKKIMDVNYLGAVALTKAVLPYFRRQQSGQFVVISSVMGKIGTPRRSAYAAAKHALHGFYDSLRAEVTDAGITVTVICPGYVQTNVSINALSGDGSKHNAMGKSTENGIEPGEFARRALRAIAAGKREVIIAGPRERAGVWINHFFPGLFARMIRRVRVT